MTGILAISLFLAAAVVEPPSPEERDSIALSLNADLFSEREAALEELWARGDEALNLLKAISLSDDPETVWRARRILRMLDLQLKSDTNPEIIALVERFLDSDNTEEREQIFDQLEELSALPQMIRLPKHLPQNEIRSLFEERVDGLVSRAALDLILAEKEEDALELVALSRESPLGILRWVSLASAMGKREELWPELDAEDRLRFARREGNVELVRELAPADHEVQATLQILDGNPVPLIEKFSKRGGIDEQWGQIAIALWEGREEEVAIVKTVEKMLDKAQNRSERLSFTALTRLSKLGYREEVMPIFEERFPDDIFALYLREENITKALQCFDLEAGKGIEPAWIQKNIGLMEGAWDMRNQGSSRIIKVALLLHKQGDLAQSEILLRALYDRINEFGDEGQSHRFLSHLGGLDFLRIKGLSDMNLSAGFPELGLELARERNDESFPASEFVRLAFDGNESVVTFYDFLDETYPELDDWQKARLTLAAFGRVVTSTREEVEQYLSAYEAKVIASDDPSAWEVLLASASARGNIELVERCLQALLVLSGGELTQQISVASFSFYDRDFEKSSQLWKEIMAERPLGLLPDGHCYEVVTMQMAGDEKGSREVQDAMSKLALGDDSWLPKLANVWDLVGDYERQYECARHALLLLPAESKAWNWQLTRFGHAAQMAGKWKQAAAARMITSSPLASSYQAMPAFYFESRSQIDYNRAMAALAEGEVAKGNELLLRAAEVGGHSSFFANEVFWELRKAGHMDQVAMLWEKLSPLYRENIALYPDADKSLNAGAWVASRAGVDLDDATQWVERALEIKPTTAAYLDTKAEVFFAQGNREKAREWSLIACAKSRGMQELGLLRLQLRHFDEDPFHLTSEGISEPEESPRAGAVSE